MTESSDDIFLADFLLGYFLHPYYIEHGALRLLMPTVKEGETLPSDKWPPLLKRPARSSGDSQGGAATNGHDISDRRVQRRRVKPLSSASFVNFLELRANVTN
ncbi:hypothetical protein C8F01DRAFT_1374925 [Mycena amicta]|nr:hypothetical protein C8F01DRAFT_1374925 [Mycena amicta]